MGGRPLHRPTTLPPPPRRQEEGISARARRADPSLIGVLATVVFLVAIVAGLVYLFVWAVQKDQVAPARFITNEQGHVCELVQRRPTVLYRCDERSQGIELKEGAE